MIDHETATLANLRDECEMLIDRLKDLSQQCVAEQDLHKSYVDAETDRHKAEFLRLDNEVRRVCSRLRVVQHTLRIHEERGKP